MKNRTNQILFTLGFAIGSYISWKWLKKREEGKMLPCEEPVTEEPTPEPEENPVKKNEEEKGPDIFSYVEKLRESGYIVTVNEDEPVDFVKEPYTITPSEYGERDDYDTDELMYFADGVLAFHDSGEELSPEEIDNCIGEKSLEKFGEYEDDALYVRNERQRCDYSVLLDDREYEDFLRTRPDKER